MSQRVLFTAIAVCLMTTLRTSTGEDVVLRGAGASFPNPLYQKWIADYSITGSNRVLYESVGSGEGIRRLLATSIDFAGSDAYLTDEDIKKAPAEIIHVPTCLGAVVVTYNLPGNPKIKLTGSILADIFLGRIKKWSDTKIQYINKDVRLPEIEIVVIHRADSSGTTFIFTDYLSKVSYTWKREAGCGKTVRWPSGIGVDQNIGIVESVKQIKGSIGYQTS